ncbi:MAG: hypothetical protein LBC97_03900 [Bifidobacteriaceae bacterium]|jgi:hypothetical protein|nr:hypothetical protein [Bifidobacteriaceae bacterium]
MSDSQPPQGASGPAKGAPKAYKPLNAGKIAMGLIVTLLVSWGVIGGVVAYAVNTDLVDKTKQTVSDARDKAKKPTNNQTQGGGSSNAPAEGFGHYVATAEVSRTSVTLGDYTVSLTGAAAEEWEFIDQRARAGADCVNKNNLAILCRLGNLTLRDNGTDASMMFFGIMKSISEGKTLANFGTGTEIDIPGANVAYIYNSDNLSDYSRYIQGHSAMIELDNDLTFFVRQMDDTLLFKTQEDFDKYTKSDKYKLLLSDVDDMITSLKVSK